MSSTASVRVAANTFLDPDQGSCLVDHSGGFGALTFEGNHYSSSAVPGSWFCEAGSHISLAQWRTVSGETTADDQVPAFIDPGRNIASYAGTLGLASSIEGFVAAARLQSRYTWDPQLTAMAVNDYIRAGYATTAPPALSIDDTGTSEGDSGTKALTFDVHLAP